MLASRTNEQIQSMVAAYRDGEVLPLYASYAETKNKTMPYDVWCVILCFVLFFMSSPAYGRDMEEDIVGDTSGHFKKMLVALLQVSKLMNQLNQCGDELVVCKRAKNVH